MSVDRAGRTVLVANYGGGSVASLPIGADGSLGPAASVIVHQGSSVHPKRQTKPYAHSINMDPSNTFAYAADLGVDRIFIYRLDPKTSALTPATPASAALTPGSGPRHLSFHPSGRYAYVINEIALTVTVFSRDAKTGGADRDADDRHAASGPGGRSGVQHRRGRRPPVREVPLRLQPRARQPRRLRD